MAEAFNLLRRVRSLEVSPELSGYSGVRIYAGQDDEGNSIEYFSGDETGKVLEITNDWGTQAQADSICSRILGYRYQPYVATGSQIDPSVELGDAVTTSDVYGGVFSRRSTYGRRISSDVSAPFYDEIEHEFQIQSPTNRQYDRFTRQVRATISITNSKIVAEVEARTAQGKELHAAITVEAKRITQEVADRQSDTKSLTSKITQEAGRITQEITDRTNAINSVNSVLSQQADLISARVTKIGGDYSSFGWNLTDSYWELQSGHTTVLKVDRNGLEVRGKITALSGKIGGFDIMPNYLSYNGQTWGGTNTLGAYLGASGLQLGQNFKVDMSGNLTAQSGKFNGTIYAQNISYGDYNGGYLNGGAISGGSLYGDRLVANTITTDYTSKGINSSLARADAAYNWFTGVETAKSFIAQEIKGTSKGSFKQLFIDGVSVTKKSATVKGSDGKNLTISFWG